MAFSGITGHTGEIRVGGRVAGRLGVWNARRVADEDKWVIGAALADHNPLWLPPQGTGPFEVRLDVGKQQWRWRPVELIVDGSGVSVTAYRRFEVV